MQRGKINEKLGQVSFSLSSNFWNVFYINSKHPKVNEIDWLLHFYVDVCNLFESSNGRKILGFDKIYMMYLIYYNWSTIWTYNGTQHCKNDGRANEVSPMQKEKVQSCLRNQWDRGNRVGCQTGRRVIYILGHLTTITRGNRKGKTIMDWSFNFFGSDRSSCGRLIATFHITSSPSSKYH